MFAVPWMRLGLWIMTPSLPNHIPLRVILHQVSIIFTQFLSVCQCQLVAAVRGCSWSPVCLQRLNLLRPPNNFKHQFTHSFSGGISLGIQKGVVSISYIQGLILAEPFLILSNNVENYLPVPGNFGLSFNEFQN